MALSAGLLHIGLSVNLGNTSLHRSFLNGEFSANADVHLQDVALQ
jgi:hypothetical protein